jgi:hypothetical protein
VTSGDTYNCPFQPNITHGEEITFLEKLKEILVKNRQMVPKAV